MSRNFSFENPWWFIHLQVSILRSLDQTNVLKLLGVMYKDKKLNFVAEFVDGTLTLYLLVSTTDNLCKQFGPRPGLTKCWAWSVSLLFNTLMVFLKENFQKKLILKNTTATVQTTKKACRQRFKRHSWYSKTCVKQPLSKETKKQFSIPIIT